MKTSLSEEDNGDLDLDIKKSSKLIGIAWFTVADEDGWVSYSDRNKSETFNEVLVLIGDSVNEDEYTITTLLALFMASDPTLDIDDAYDMSGDILDELEDDGEIGFITKNGITYALMLYDGDSWVIRVDCSD